MSCDICDSSLDKQTYTNLTKILQSEGFKVFYPWNQLQGKQASRTPSPINLPDPHESAHYLLPRTVETLLLPFWKRW